MQGIYVSFKRPASKKAIKEAIAANPASVALEATSIFGNEYDGVITNAPDGSYTFVGPDPHTSRKFYGTITKRGEKITVK
jgi:hypothetical protein